MTAQAPWIARQARQLLAQRGHAWLLQGPSGLGQYGLALELARAWLCDQPGPAGACGQCPSCHAIEVRAHTDLCVLMPETIMLELGWPLGEKAQKEIDAELATDVLIIEDEAVISADIEALVRELGHNVVAVSTTRTEAVDAVANHRPGLVLADIQLADGSSGIDAVKDILKRIDVPVIFITAFPERLLTGERPEPTFLITKPFQPETVKAAISQALFFHPSRQQEAA